MDHCRQISLCIEMKYVATPRPRASDVPLLASVLKPLLILLRQHFVAISSRCSVVAYLCAYLPQAWP